MNKTNFALYAPLDEYLIAEVLDVLPVDVRAYLVNNGPKVCLAGGFIRSILLGETPNDIDLMFASEEDYINATSWFTVSRDRIRTSGCASTLNGDPPLQLIRRWYGNPREHVVRFDFSMCQAVLWYDDGWKSCCYKDFVKDSRAKRLEYMSPTREEEPLGSLARALRFYARGYTMGSGSFAALVQQTIKNVGDDKDYSTILVGMAFRAGMGGY